MVSLNLIMGLGLVLSVELFSLYMSPHSFNLSSIFSDSWTSKNGAQVKTVTWRHQVKPVRGAKMVGDHGPKGPDSVLDGSLKQADVDASKLSVLVQRPTGNPAAPPR